jgi:SAM-dependent methyltransferase
MSKINSNQVNWFEYWNSYRKCDVVSDDSLFYQVGKTINSIPIDKSVFKLMIERICVGLKLCPTDSLLDLCCGNGLLTFELAQIVSGVTGVDFSNHLIETARKYKACNNIKYVACDILAEPFEYIAPNFIPNKIVMNAALAYFSPSHLFLLLSNFIALTNNNFSAYFTDVPIEKYHPKFYNTPERLRRYESNKASGRGDNDGLGRWWTEIEINEVVERLNLSVHFFDQPEILSNYRMDILISSIQAPLSSVRH